MQEKRISKPTYVIAGIFRHGSTGMRGRPPSFAGRWLIVEKSVDHDLIGKKEFPSEEDRHAILCLYVTGSQRPSGSILFVTATEEHFDVKASSESTSIGVPLTPLHQQYA